MKVLRNFASGEYFMTRIGVQMVRPGCQIILNHVLPHFTGYQRRLLQKGNVGRGLVRFLRHRLDLVGPLVAALLLELLVGGHVGLRVRRLDRVVRVVVE